MSHKISGLVQDIKLGNHRTLARVITFLESKNLAKRQLGQQVLQELKQSHVSRKIAFTGPPGAGKSSLIETIGLKLIDIGVRIAVLTIDPSSPISGGSILADKTRMQKLSNSSKAFIRPSSSGKRYLGGINAATIDVIDLIEAVGYDFIIVETIGVGQNEIDIKDLVDKVILVLPPVSGDELQGLKKGINEIIDLIAVSKHDGPLKKSAELTALYYESSLNLSSNKAPVHLCSAIEGSGIDALIKFLMTYQISPTQRQEQILNIFEKIALEELMNHIASMPQYKKIINCEREAILKKKSSLRESIECVSSFAKRIIFPLSFFISTYNFADQINLISHS